MYLAGWARRVVWQRLPNWQTSSDQCKRVVVNWDCQPRWPLMSSWSSMDSVNSQSIAGSQPRRRSVVPFTFHRQLKTWKKSVRCVRRGVVPGRCSASEPSTPPARIRRSQRKIFWSFNVNIVSPLPTTLSSRQDLNASTEGGPKQGVMSRCSVRVGVGTSLAFVIFIKGRRREQNQYHEQIRWW